MELFNRFAAFFLAIFLTASFAGCAPTTKERGAGQYIDDTVITAKVKAAIVDDPTLKASEIKVDVYKGRVQLSGFVSSADQIARASQVARGVSGVTSVVNDLRLR